MVLTLPAARQAAGWIIRFLGLIFRLQANLYFILYSSHFNNMSAKKSFPPTTRVVEPQ